MVAKAELDFCCNCGCWIAADSGSMRSTSDGVIEILCDDCLQFERGGVVIVPDSLCGMLDKNYV